MHKFLYPIEMERLETTNSKKEKEGAMIHNKA